MPDPLDRLAAGNRAGEALFSEACAKGREGLIAERASAAYQGSRTSDWLKLKCSRGQQLVIAGFSAPPGSRRGCGALLLDYYDEGAGFRYAGKVDTGFDDRTLIELLQPSTGWPPEEVGRERTET